MRLLALTAVEAERAAVLRHLGRAADCAVGPYAGSAVDTRAGQVVAVTTGVGMAAAAAVTATAFALDDGYAAVVCLGIGGGFDGVASCGDVVVATELVAADLGARSAAGFETLADLGIGETVLPAGPAARELAARLGGVAGVVLTVASVTGTDERATELTTRWAPVAEAMEGFGVAAAARPYGVAVYEVRAVSNRCGRRDRASWDLPRALDALSRASSLLFAEPLPTQRPGRDR
jgi:futalosine hydrolase